MLAGGRTQKTQATTFHTEVAQAMSGSVMRDGYSAIGDYALIGDTRTAALVSLEGSIDWLCLPRFDSPSVFAALLDAGRGGRFRVAPSDPYRATSRYVPESNVLETTFETQSGSLVLRDSMTLAVDPAARLAPEHEVLREIECTSGTLEVTVEFAPRPDYASRPARLEDRGRLGLRCFAGQAILTLISDERLTIEPDGISASARFRLAAGERRHISLAADTDAPAVLPSLGDDAGARLAETTDWWRSWAERCTYDGPYREAVRRSALVLKLLAFAPSGAIIAAPTSSLPEEIGGERNYDYRFCWLRDASFVMRALHSIGYRPLADAFLAWMLHATRLTHPELQVVYDVYGRTNLAERELPHLEGYRRSRPVRVGNAACHQFQLDVYGEVIDAAERFVEAGGELDSDQTQMLEGFADTVCRRWHEPDDGIWESRGQRQHYVHSKVLCWVALDRIVRMHERGRLRTQVDRFRRVRDEIRQAIEARGFDRRSGSYLRAFGRDEVDGSLLTLPLLGYVRGDDPRMLGTLERLTRELADGPLYRRYRHGTNDGFRGGEATFGICSFWAVECRVLAGDVDAARAQFEELLGHANDVGLFAEQIDANDGAALGNFPQAFTHIGLINAALTLTAAQEDRR